MPTHRLIGLFRCLALALCVTACGTLEIGIERSPTPALTATARQVQSVVRTATLTAPSPVEASPTPSVTPTAPIPTAIPTRALRPTLTPSIPTPTPVVTITSFVAAPAQIRRGDPVTLTWSTSGAQVVSLNRLGPRGQLAEPGTAVSSSASLVVDTSSLDVVDQTYAFVLYAGAGEAWVQAVARVEVICETVWFFPDPPAVCPGQPHPTQVQAEHFEHGLMLWTRFDDSIYILYDDGQTPSWGKVLNAWFEGMPENDPNIVPPPGFYQPARGFGMAWRESSETPVSRVRDRLGWATGEEFTVENAVLQCDTVSYTTCYLTGPGGAVFVLQPEFSGWSVWIGSTATP